MADERKPFGAWAPNLGDDPFAQLMASRGYSTDPLAQTQQGSQAVLNGLGTAGQFVAQPVLDAAHYADALNRGQANWDTTTGLGLGANMAMALWPFSRSGMLAKDAVEAGASAIPRVANPIRAYHGSPHDFDAFDLSKIGSGEGAQAYGHGLYFAENPEVIHQYRMVGGWNSPQNIAADLLHGNSGDRRGAVDTMVYYLTNPESSGEPEAIQRHGSKALELLLEDDAPKAGHGYEVNIHADPEHFLDVDLPNSQQSAHVQNALRQAGLTPTSPDLGSFAGSPVQGAPRWADRPEDAAALQRAGIPGLKYLDQGSRSAGQGTRNYVVFDPKIIEIMRKYGLAGPIAAAALNRPDDSQ